MTLTKRKPIGRKTRFAVLAAGGFRCHYCGRRPLRAFLEVDHVVPVSRGGTNHPRNLVPACQDCNGGKSDSTLDRLTVTWQVLIDDHQPGRCPNDRHAGPLYEMAVLSPGGFDDCPGEHLTLVCKTCDYVVAYRCVEQAA